MSENSLDVLAIANLFDINGKAVEAIPFGSGHINDTYKIVTDAKSDSDYLFQRINHHIFSDVNGLMNNIAAVCDHLKSKLSHLPASEVIKRTMTMIPLSSGEKYLKDEQGRFWRMFILIPDTKSYDIVETQEQAYSGGLAFGQFQKYLSDMDTSRLVEILPNFHNLDFRMTNLRRAIERDPKGRVAELGDVLRFIDEREDRMRTILKEAEKGNLPVRITHNDTKFNNVLLDKNDQVQCVIDLDTVMPGYVAYDFGDAIRTIINSAVEDEADPEKIKLNIPLFRAYTQGYLEEASGFLTENEIESLLHGVFLLPFMQGVRFLTDYIDGDLYYKIKYSTHNFVRAKSQFKLVTELEREERTLKDIIYSTVSC